MPYNSVSTPRFYINIYEFLASTGYLEMPSYDGVNPGHYYTLPVNPTLHTGGESDLPSYPNILNNTFVAFLGHDMSADYSFDVYHTEIVNGTPSSGYKGFSISKLDAQPGVLNLNAECNVGSIVIGSYYDMPHSPDLNLTLSYEYGGIKTIETKGGASLSNATYTKPQAWGSLGAWELGNDTDILYRTTQRSGRKIYNLSFSYLDDGDVFGSNQSLFNSSWINETSGDYDAGDIVDSGNDAGGFTYNLLTDDNFYSQVVHRVQGSRLPFIFQPDNNDNTNFAICKFDMKNFKFDQVANGVYNVKLKIREVW